ncbi:alpha/beta hydrolase [Plantactinospora sp. GCM10030261]|uniref:alpha/beta hydrolase n=1 Tax=Plantactinospora sp. GCM10030261 TaxID=3273420 RepID=UPI003623C4C4
MTEESPRIARLLRELSTGRRGVVDEFWRDVTATGAPLVEDVRDGEALVTFLWRGEAAETATYWGVDVPLRRIEGTDLWYGSRRLRTDLRTIYLVRHRGFAIPTDVTGVGPTHVDPLNPHRLLFPADPADPHDRNYWMSLLELPAAPTESWSTPRPGVPRGRHRQTSLRSTALRCRRRIGVYRPAGAGNEPLPLLVVFDGHISRAVLRIPTTLDNLIAAGRIPPTMALFVSAPSGGRRDRELRPGPAMRHFVLHELLPWARRRWRISADPGQRVIAGASLGGLTAAYLGLIAPDVFGAVIAQSASFWWPAPPTGREPQWLTREYARRPAQPVRLYLDVGDHETNAYWGDGLDQVSVNRRFRDVVVERGYDVTYAEYTGGHDYVNWRRTIADGLVAVLGGPGTPGTGDAAPVRHGDVPAPAVRARRHREPASVAAR